MSSIQTSMQNYLSAAYEGQRAPSPGDLVVTKMAQSAIDAGQGVKQGTADEQCDLPSASGDVTGLPNLGIAIYDESLPNAWPPGTSNCYPAGQAVSILRRGRIWVYVEEAVTPASTPYMRYASGAGGSKVGRFRASADTATAAAFPGSRFVTSAGAGALALLEINLPQ
jgi:hypothetical protein